MGKNKKFVWGKVCAAALCVTVLTASADGIGSVKVQASSIGGLQSQLSQLQQENAARDKLIKELGADINSNKELMGLVSAQIDGIDKEIAKYSELVAAKKSEIDTKSQQIAEVEKSIADREIEIDDKKDEIAELKRKNDENLAKFAKLIRAMYMNDTSNKLPVLNGSDDWYDYFVYSDVVRNISGQNARFMKELMDSIKEQEDLIRDLNDEIASLEDNKRELNVQKKALEADMDALMTDKAAYENDIAQKKAYLYGLAADNEELKSKVDNLEYENSVSQQKMEQLNAQIEQLIRDANANAGETPSIGSSTDFVWPLETRFGWISCDYEPVYESYHGGAHGGVDIGDAGIANTNIYAAQEGTVIAANYGCTHNYGKNYTCCVGLGNYVIIRHPNGYATAYGHMTSPTVTVGQYVQQGDVIGHVGTTGWSTGYHLHFEVRDPNGKKTNPHDYTYVNKPGF